MIAIEENGAPGKWRSNYVKRHVLKNKFTHKKIRFKETQKRKSENKMKIKLISYLEGDCLEPDGQYGIDLTVSIDQGTYRLTQNKETGQETCTIETAPVESGLEDIHDEKYKTDLLDLAKKILEKNL